MEEKIVDAKEIAGFLGITEATVYRLAKSKKLPAVRIGNQWRFDLEIIRELFHKGAKFSDEETETNDEKKNKEDL